MTISLTTLDAMHDATRLRQQALAEVDGLEMADAYRGVFRCAGLEAQVIVEPGDWLKLTCGAGNGLAARRAMAINHHLPGNLRFAIGRLGLCLFGELPLDGAMDLGRALRDLGRGMALAHRLRANAASDSCIESEEFSGAGCDETELQSAVELLDWPAEAVVRHERGWELRPKLKGQSVPVQLELLLGQPRVYADVVHLIHCEFVEAVARQALRENGCLRGARLVLAGDAIVAEVCLDQADLGPRTLAEAVTAVAVAKMGTVGVLEALAREPDLGRWYQRLLTNGESYE